MHYFGFPDAGAGALAGAARSQGIRVLEDQAHSMLSDIVGGACGWWGDAAIYSFHKLLPVPDGGALLLPECEPAFESLLADAQECEAIRFYEYDLRLIAERRRSNARALLRLLASYRTPVTPLYKDVPPGVVPQTLPVLVPSDLRDELYFRLNDEGYGVVSLYHTLIDVIQPEFYPESLATSKAILNLPVHQDISEAGLEELVISLTNKLVSNRTEKNVAFPCI
jgi:dTDP-4-amino-4,6-dideoxygalactose transaminase